MTDLSYREGWDLVAQRVNTIIVDSTHAKTLEERVRALMTLWRELAKASDGNGHPRVAARYREFADMLEQSIESLRVE